MTGDLQARPGPAIRTRVVEHTTGAERAREDRLITEEPLEIRVSAGGLDARRAWVTMRTPGHDFELAAGWLVNEGLASPSSLGQIAYCTDADLSRDQEFNVVTVTLTTATDIPHRHSGAGSSACGVCGKDSVAEAMSVHGGPAWSGPRPGAVVVRRLPEGLREQQKLFSRTGGVHAAGLADADGTLLVVREDVGRHNAVDKVVGARVLAGQDRGGRVPRPQRPGGLRARAEGCRQRDRLDRRGRRPDQPRAAARDRGRDRPVGLHVGRADRALRLSASGASGVVGRASAWVLNTVGARA